MNECLSEVYGQGRNNSVRSMTKEKIPPWGLWPRKEYFLEAYDQGEINFVRSMSMEGIPLRAVCSSPMGDLVLLVCSISVLLRQMLAKWEEIILQTESQLALVVFSFNMYTLICPTLRFSLNLEFSDSLKVLSPQILVTGDTGDWEP